MASMLENSTGLAKLAIREVPDHTPAIGASESPYALKGVPHVSQGPWPGTKMATLPVDKTASTPNWKKWQSVDMASSVLSTALGGVHAPSAGPLTSSTDLMQQGAARSEQAALHAFASAVLHFTARSMANAAVEERQEAAAELSVPNGPAEASSDGNEVGTKGIHSGRQESTAMPSITVQADCRPASGVLPAESMPRADSQLQEAPTNPAQGPHAGAGEGAGASPCTTLPLGFRRVEFRLGCSTNGGISIRPGFVVACPQHGDSRIYRYAALSRLLQCHTICRPKWGCLQQWEGEATDAYRKRLDACGLHFRRVQASVDDPPAQSQHAAADSSMHSSPPLGEATAQLADLPEQAHCRPAGAAADSRLTALLEGFASSAEQLLRDRWEEQQEVISRQQGDVAALAKANQGLQKQLAQQQEDHAAEVGLLHARMSEQQTRLARSTAELSQRQPSNLQQADETPAQACADPGAAPGRDGSTQHAGASGVKRKRKQAANPVRAEGAAQRRSARPCSADDAAAEAAAQAVAVEQVRRALLHVRSAAAGICRLKRVHLTNMARARLVR